MDIVNDGNMSILDRIATYISNCVKFYEDPNVNQNLAHFVKLRKLFIFENDGSIDVVAMETLSKLCKKKDSNPVS